MTWISAIFRIVPLNSENFGHRLDTVIRARSPTCLRSKQTEKPVRREPNGLQSGGWIGRLLGSAISQAGIVVVEFFCFLTVSLFVLPEVPIGVHGQLDGGMTHQRLEALGNGKYVDVYRRQKDGNWKIIATMYSTDKPAK